MKKSKPLIIGLALVLLVAIGYALYLHRGPVKRISDENEKMVAEIDQLKRASENSKADSKARLDEKTRLIEDLERKNAELEEAVSRVKNEKHVTEADAEKLQSTIALLESEKETLGRKAEGLSRQLQESKNQLEALRKELETKTELEKQSAELRSRLQAISDDLASRDRKIFEMEETHQSLLSQIDRQKKEKEELERLKDGLRTQLGMTQSQIESLSMATEAKEEQLKSKEKQLKSMEKAMQELSKHFERQIREKEIQISALEDKLNIRLMDRILFASGSAEITPAGYQVLKSLAAELKSMEGFEIAVSGHTDDIPLGPKIKEVYHDNLGLSVARAAAVSRVLRERGVPPDHLSAVGHSMYRPVAANDTEEGRRQNRRVEIILAPLR